MTDVLFRTLVTFLAVYAVMDIVIRLLNHFFAREPYCSDDVFIILKVLNREKDLECIVRGLIWKNLTINNGGFVPNLLIVDMGSDDETGEIAKRLSQDYSFIYYTTKERFEAYRDD